MKWFTPGPVEVPKEILKEARMLYHRSPEFLKIYDEVREIIKAIAKSENVALLPGSGTVGIEALFAYRRSQHNKCHVYVNGLFGERLVEQAQRWKFKEVEMDVFSPGQGYVVNLSKHKCIAVVEGETSTGTLNIIEGHSKGAIIDKVSSFPITDGPLPFVTSSQKFLAAPPGVSIIAYDTLEGEVPLYFDLKNLEKGPFTTPPVLSITALYHSLKKLEEESLLMFRNRHYKAMALTTKRLKEMGFELPSTMPHPGVTLFLLPNQKIRDDLLTYLKKRGYLIAGGKGVFEGREARIGHMGFFELDDLNNLLDEIELFSKRLL